MGGLLRAWVLVVGVWVCLACAAPAQQQQQQPVGGGGGAPPPAPQPAADCRTQCRNLITCGGVSSREYNTCVDACYANDQGYMSARRESCQR